jgi:hypothetical protein
VISQNEKAIASTGFIFTAEFGGAYPAVIPIIPEIMQNIPVVNPGRDRNLLNLLTIIELKAKYKPSVKSLKNIQEF